MMQRFQPLQAKRSSTCSPHAATLFLTISLICVDQVLTFVTISPPAVLVQRRNVADYQSLPPRLMSEIEEDIGDFELDNDIRDLWFSGENDDEEDNDGNKDNDMKNSNDDLDLSDELGLDDIGQLWNMEDDDDEEEEDEYQKEKDTADTFTTLSEHVVADQANIQSPLDLLPVESDSTSIRPDKASTEADYQKTLSLLANRKEMPPTIRPGKNGTAVEETNSFTKNEKDSYFWDIRLESLREYHKEHGHIDVPYLYEVELNNRSSNVIDQNSTDSEMKEKSRLPLGSFVAWLRTAYANESLENKVPSHVLHELDSLGITWVMGKGRRPQQFKSRIEEWKRLVESDDKSLLTENSRLRTWMWKQRYFYAKTQQGRHTPFTNEQIEDLKEAGILPFNRSQATLQSVFDSQWHQMLQNHREICHASHDNEDDDSSTLHVRLWAWEQQRMYDILRGVSSSAYLPPTITGPRLQALTEAGVVSDNNEIDETYPPIAPEMDVARLPIDFDTFWSGIDAFQKKYGHCRAQPLSTDIGESSLYSMCRRLIWEYNQMQQNGVKEYKGVSILNDDRIAKLGKIGLFEEGVIETTPAKEYHWWEQYHELRRYRDIHGNVNVTLKEAPTLHGFLQLQQLHYENAIHGTGKETISEAHYITLSNLGVVFESNTTSIEPPALDTAKEPFVGRRPAVMDLEDGVIAFDSLATSLKRKDSAEEMTWLVRLNEMKSFIEECGHSNVQKSELPRLALWANNQRIQYARFIEGKTPALTPFQTSMLKGIGFSFQAESPKVQLSEDTTWDCMLEELKKFKNINGHCFIPANLPSNRMLGQWVHTQRQLYQQPEQQNAISLLNNEAVEHDLTDERILELREVGLDLDMSNFEYSSMSFQTLWDDRVSELIQLKKQFGAIEKGLEQGNSNELNTWATEIKQLHKVGISTGLPTQLTKERLDELLSIGFSFDDK